jgi:GNAT superfamily N-acetyltransferase
MTADPDLRLEAAEAARCSLWWRAAPRLPGERVGLIGHYAAGDLRSGTQVLEMACERLRASGCTLAVGPMDGSTWRRYRLLTWRGAEPLFFLEPDNPDDWPAHFERSGFLPLAQYFSAKCDDLGGYPCDEALDARLRAAGYRARPIDIGRLDEELGLLWRLAVDAFSRNFLYTEVGEAEFKELYAPVIPVVQPQLVNIVEHRGEPVAFVFAVPDALQSARGKPIDTVVVKTMGTLRSRQAQGLGNWMLDLTLARARELGYRRAILALMHENNPSRRLGRGRAHDIRRYMLYARRL